MASKRTSTPAAGRFITMTRIVEHIVGLAQLLEEPMQEKLWEYAELLYVEQVAFESTEPGRWTFESLSSQRAFSAQE